MAVVAVGASESDVRQFVSPLRILVRSFRASRDRWKAKAGRLKTEVKRWKVSVPDVQQSRARWRQRAEAAEQELVALRAQTPARTAASPEASPPPKSVRAAS